MDGIAPEINHLIDNLNHQLGLYRQLIDLLRDEREHLIAVRTKEIREATYSKEAILDEIQRAEFQRKKWTKSAAHILNMSEKELTMEIISLKLGAANNQQNLANLKSSLVLLITKAREMNSENLKLVHAALKDVQEMKHSVLGISPDKAQTYGPKGNMGNSTRDQSSRLLSKEL